MEVDSNASHSDRGVNSNNNPDPVVDIQYTFKGTKHQVSLPTLATIQTLLEAIAAQTRIPLEGQKVLLKGKILHGEQTSTTTTTTTIPNNKVNPPLQATPTLLNDYPDLINGKTKLMVLGTSNDERATIQKMDNRIQTRQAYAPPKAVKRSQPVRSLDDDDNKYSFGRIEVLPQFDQQDKARAYLERLAKDNGIRGIMKLHHWSVGSLIELSPAERSILGYNRNKGELIAIRIRTDDLDGFRHYDAVRKVLLHELVHNVWSEHDENFHELNRQLNKEVQQLDWTANGGNRVSNQGERFYEPSSNDWTDSLETNNDTDHAWQGGAYVLGGGTSSHGSRKSSGQQQQVGGGTLASAIEGLTLREQVARAAQLRQIENEKKEDELCGGSH